MASSNDFQSHLAQMRFQILYVIRTISNMTSTQVEAAGHQILLAPTGKAPYPAGKHRKWKQYSGQKFSEFFPNNFRSVPAGNHRKLVGIRPKIPERNILLSCSVDVRYLPSRSDPCFSTWVSLFFYFQTKKCTYNRLRHLFS